MEAASVDCAYTDGAYDDGARTSVLRVDVEAVEEWPRKGRLGRRIVDVLSKPY